MKPLEILITLSYESTRDSMDFSEDDDYDGDAVLFQQGYDMDVMVVEPGDEFEIEEDFGGQINCEETQYKLIKLKEEWEEEADEWDEDYYRAGEPINLRPGNYRFLEDGITIEEIA
jgi:hypothetical protein